MGKNKVDDSKKPAWETTPYGVWEGSSVNGLPSNWFKLMVLSKILSGQTVIIIDPKSGGPVQLQSTQDYDYYLKFLDAQ